MLPEVTPGAARGFPLFWTARGASQFGDQITLLALPWLVASTTNSPLATGLLEAAAFAPVLLFGFHLGALADRRSRRRSMVQADLFRIALLLTVPIAVALNGDVRLGQVIAVAFLVGIGQALFEASAQPFLADLVPKEELVKSNAKLSFTEGLAEVAGPALAGVLIAAIGASQALVVDAATFAISAIALLAVVKVSERIDTSGTPYRRAIRDGLRVLVRTPQLRALTGVQASANLGSGVFAGLLVFFLQRTLGLSGWHAGLVFAVNGAGGILAGVLASRVTARIGVARSVLAGVMSGGVGFLLVAVASPSSWPVLATAGMGIIGVGVVTAVIASSTLRQQLVPGEFLGRVTAGYRAVVNGSIAVGAVAGGAIGNWIGVRTGLLTGAGIYLIVGVAGLATALNVGDPVDT